MPTKTMILGDAEFRHFPLRDVRATEELDRGLDQYQLVKFLIPVHSGTLADAATVGTCARFCNSKIWSVREFAYFEIIKPPATVSGDELAQAADQTTEEDHAVPV